MIKFAVIKSKKQIKLIKWCKNNMLKWKNDSYFKNYNMKINYDMMQINIRILKNLIIQYSSVDNAAVINLNM